jgi:hypothetical protein
MCKRVVAMTATDFRALIVLTAKGNQPSTRNPKL